MSSATRRRGRAPAQLAHQSSEFGFHPRSYLPLTRKKKSSLNKPQKHRCEVYSALALPVLQLGAKKLQSLTFFLWKMADTYLTGPSGSLSIQ